MIYKELSEITRYIPNFLETDAGSIDFGFIDFVAKIPGSIHHILNCSQNNSSFLLDNYSHWWASNIEAIQNWKSEDQLFITQNQSFFSPYRFAIVNLRLQKAMPISLLKEPLPIENKTFFILSIDLSNDLINLSNGIELRVDSHDHGTLRKFSENDRALIGVNCSDKRGIGESQDAYKSYILIDTTSNSYVRADPVV